ncbi:MAG: glycerol-3-phosphate 1-O-acyltransferase PlsY [Candidatus Kapaibacterium sp.]
MVIDLALTAILSYLLGSIPTAVLVSKLFFGFDIRDKGSGNMGSTNAFRLLGWKWGAVVQIVDILKGMAAVLLVARWFGPDITRETTSIFSHMATVEIFAGVCAVAGHIWSVFVNFRGGKGINTAAGMLLAIVPADLGIGLAVFILAVMLSGFVSLGSILGALTLPLSLFVRRNFFGAEIDGYQILIYFLLALALLMIFTHRSNVKRLIKGEENRFAKLQLLKRKSTGK